MGMLRVITGCAALWIRASSAGLSPHPTLHPPMGCGYRCPSQPDLLYRCINQRAHVRHTCMDFLYSSSPRHLRAGAEVEASAGGAGRTPEGSPTSKAAAPPSTTTATTSWPCWCRDGRHAFPLEQKRRTSIHVNININDVLCFGLPFAVFCCDFDLLVFLSFDSFCFACFAVFCFALPCLR